MFCPETRTFNIDESRPLIVPHEYIQPVEVPILEYFHNTNYNNKLYYLIINTPHEFSPSSKEQKIIKAIGLLWPLLQKKYVTRLLAKLLTSSDTIHYSQYFPSWVFANDE